MRSMERRMIGFKWHPPHLYAADGRGTVIYRYRRCTARSLINSEWIPPLMAETKKRESPHIELMHLLIKAEALDLLPRAYETADRLRRSEAGHPVANDHLPARVVENTDSKLQLRGRDDAAKRSVLRITFVGYASGDSAS